jgi:hypothetical protein
MALVSMDALFCNKFVRWLQTRACHANLDGWPWMGESTIMNIQRCKGKLWNDLKWPLIYNQWQLLCVISWM